jgi:CubicO group peptidase (beta-lactamase class C family)
MFNRSKTIIIIAITTILIALTACGGQPAAALESMDDLIAQIDARLPGLRRRYSVPGVSIALIEDGEIVYLENFGFADRENRVPMTSNTAYQVASISKCLTAWGVLKLADDEIIALDDPVENYLTRWHIPPSPYDSSGATIRRLLSHTAGISLSGYGAGRTLDEPLPRLEESLLGDTKGCGAVELIREPGEAFMYSGGGYTILQLLVEEVTGQTFAEYMEENILQPLGMGNSTFIWDEELQSRLARAYGTYHNVIPNYRYIEDAAGGLYSTITDMAHYAQAVLNGSDVLTEESFDLMFGGDSYGLGHGLIEFPTGQRFIFGGGTRMGWQSDFVLYPEGRSGIVILSNANGGVIMNLEIINLWVEWKTGITWPGSELFSYQYPVLVAIAIVLGTVCAIYTIILFRQFRKGKRTFLFQGAGHRKALRVIFALLLLSAIVVWWLVGFTATFDPQAKALWLPEPFLYVSIFFTCLMLAMTVGSLFPKKE